MISRKFFSRAVWVATLACFGAALPGAGILRASDFKVQGTYAFHAVIGPGLGSSLGIVKVDSSGAFTGYALLNLPSADGQGRTLVRILTSGTVTVNPDGTGVWKFPAGIVNGMPTPDVTEDFVITKAERTGGVKLALEFFNQRQQASFLLGMANEVSTVYTRLPDDDDN